MTARTIHVSGISLYFCDLRLEDIRSDSSVKAKADDMGIYISTYREL